MDVLVDHSVSVALLLALLAAAAFGMCAARQQRGYLVASAVLLLACAGVLALDAFVASPAEQVTSLVEALAEAAERGDAERIVSAVSPTYAYGGQTHASLSNLIRGEFGHTRFRSISINGLAVEADADKATAKFVAMIDGSYPGSSAGRYPVRLKLSFTKGNGQWLLERVQRFEPITNTDQEIPLLQR